MQDAFRIEPEGGNCQEPMKVLFGIPFLVINQPELPVGSCHDTMMARAKHVSAAVGDWVAGVFYERTCGRLGRGITDAIIRRVGARAGVSQVIGALAL